MQDSLDLVNEIAARYADVAERDAAEGNADRAERNQQRVKTLKALIEEVKRLRDATKPIPAIKDDDLSDLPRELLKELSISKTDELEDQIYTVISAAGGQADIDTILVYLFRRFEVIQKRRFLQNKLWRMTRKGLLSSVRGKKGVYATELQEGEEADDENEDDVEDFLGLNE